MYFFLAFIWVLFEKLMIKKLPNVNSLKWIFLKTFIKKVSCLARNIDVRWYLNFIFYDFDKLLLLGYFKWILTN